MAKETRVYNGERTVFNKWCWEHWTATCIRMQLDHSYHTQKPTQSGLKTNVRPESVKLLEENIGGKLLDSWSWQFFLNDTKSKSN